MKAVCKQMKIRTTSDEPPGTYDGVGHALHRKRIPAEQVGHETDHPRVRPILLPFGEVFAKIIAAPLDDFLEDLCWFVLVLRLIESLNPLNQRTEAHQKTSNREMGDSNLEPEVDLVTCG
jgi:hypothetical protein